MQLELGRNAFKMLMNKQEGKRGYNTPTERPQCMRRESRTGSRDGGGGNSQQQPMMNYGFAKRWNYENFAEKIETLQKSMFVQVSIELTASFRLISHQVAHLLFAE